MRIYVSYKYKGSDKAGLRRSLEAVSKAIVDADHEVCIFYRDITMG